MSKEPEIIIDVPGPSSTAELVAPERQRAESMADDPANNPAWPAVGKWYYVDEKLAAELGEERADPEYGTWFGCIVHLGSNFVKLRRVADDEGHDQTHPHGVRVHVDRFWRVCTWVETPEKVIEEKVAGATAEVARLMGEVYQTFRRLAIRPEEILGPGGSNPTSSALVSLTSQPDVDAYAKALVLAKDTQLPELFKQVKEQHEIMANWMTARVIPMQAMMKAMQPGIKLVEKQIFHVELYAGLAEKTKCIRDGAPAPADTPIHLLQRRHYMDEECLASYRVGGMDYRNIDDFDQWLAEPANRDRLLPFPRCVVAFRVRRYDKQREVHSISDFFRILSEQEADRQTYLYLRNGDQVWGLRTKHDFGERLYPDLDHHTLKGGELYALRSDPRILITKDDYETRIPEWEEYRRTWKQKLADAKVAHKEMERLREEWWQANKKPGDDRWERMQQCPIEWEREPEERDFRPGEDPRKIWTLYAPSTVLYDDIRTHVAEDLEAHNRVMVIVQGVLDRSAVFQPHPPWNLWTEAGWDAAIRLVYDDNRALTPGERPDFEAYAERLRAQLQPGDITYGQEEFWMEVEQDKERERRRKNHSRDRHDVGKNWRPDHNPGPGELAQVVKIRGGKAYFVWKKYADRYDERTRERELSIGVPLDKLFNVTAYKTGDFRQFFADPRTRADYLKWAPTLLRAEEFKAGNLGYGPEGESAELPAFRWARLRVLMAGLLIDQRRLVKYDRTSGGYETYTRRKLKDGELPSISGPSAPSRDEQEKLLAELAPLPLEKLKAIHATESGVWRSVNEED